MLTKAPTETGLFSSSQLGFLSRHILDGKHVISFCEFYKDTTEVEIPEDILTVDRNGVTVIQMLESITEDDIWVY